MATKPHSGTGWSHVARSRGACGCYTICIPYLCKTVGFWHDWHILRVARMSDKWVVLYLLAVYAMCWLGVRVVFVVVPVCLVFRDVTLR